MVPHRRGVMLGLTAALAARPAAGQAPLASRLETINGIGYVRAAVPPPIVAHLVSLRNATALTDPVLEQTADPELRAFRDYLDKIVARDRPAMRQLEDVNLYVNRKVKRVADTELYHRQDLWAPPLNTLLAGGDCEDLALLKGWALIRLGFKRSDLYLVAGVTRAIPQPTFHAILGVALGSGRRIALLDNLTDTIHASAKAAHFDPTYVLNEYGFWRIETPNPADRALWDAVTQAIQP